MIVFFVVVAIRKHLLYKLEEEEEKNIKGNFTKLIFYEKQMSSCYVAFSARYIYAF